MAQGTDDTILVEISNHRLDQGPIFMKGLGQVLCLTFVQKYSQLKPEIWLGLFINTTPGIFVRSFII